MRPIRALSSAARILFIASLPALFASGAFAQATRTWVSGVGDDVNPCSRTAPCKTYAGAISKTAAGGEISTLDPGGFGAVTITKSMTISGDGTLAGILSAGTNGVIVNCTGANASCKVILRGLSIHGGNTGVNGIRFISGGELHVENVTISNVSQHGIVFEPVGHSTLFVRDTAIREAATGAVLVKPGAAGTANATLHRVFMDNNGRGLRVEDRSVVQVKDSRASGNTANGFVGLATGGGFLSLAIDNCVATSNAATGVYAGANTAVYLSNTTVSLNLDGLQVAGNGLIYSWGNNRVYSNVNSNGAPTGTLGGI